MASDSSKARQWSLVALSGGFLTLLGIAPFYIDFAAKPGFDFIENHYEAFGIGILIGIIVTFVGSIAWAKFCGRKHRAMIAGMVFVAPWLLLLIGSPIDGMNMHGPSAIAILLIIPSGVLSVVLLIMASSRPSENG